jgi:hypothetical protein
MSKLQCTVVLLSFIVTVITFSALFLCVGLYGGDKEAQAVFSIREERNYRTERQSDKNRCHKYGISPSKQRNSPRVYREITTKDAVKIKILFFMK